jgi:hypothetical protein
MENTSSLIIIQLVPEYPLKQIQLYAFKLIWLQYPFWPHGELIHGSRLTSYILFVFPIYKIYFCFFTWCLYLIIRNSKTKINKAKTSNYLLFGSLPRRNYLCICSYKVCLKVWHMNHRLNKAEKNLKVGKWISYCVINHFDQIKLYVHGSGATSFWKWLKQKLYNFVYLITLNLKPSQLFPE